ncbi:MAG TPA: hypothetical protein VLL54_18425 [Pyrinomonadaceae bacterium]|nr:hypothetical protein [Pyrinomonadaceae bacterium]
MKRCPKCNRSFPDDNQKFCTIDGGLLVIAEKAFDPNATIQGATVDLTPKQPQPPSNPQPDFGATIATPSQAPTVVFPKQTGPTGTPTSSNLHQQPGQTPPPPTTPPPSGQLPPQSVTTALPPRTPAAPAASQPAAAAAATAATAAPKKKSKLPLILGILAVLLVLGIGGIAAAFFLVIKPRLDQKSEPPLATRPTPENTNIESSSPPANVNTSTPETKPTEAEYVPPPGTTKFENVAANLDPKLAEHFVDFSFYYPSGWAADPKAGQAGTENFAKVERRLPPDFTQENFAVRAYDSKGTYADDLPDFPKKAAEFSTTLAKFFPGYKKVLERPTKINSLDGYEFFWEGLSPNTEKGDLHLWGRVVYVPTGVAGDKNGVILTMFTTSLAPELSSYEDVGTKGQMPVILESFRFGKPKT